MFPGVPSRRKVSADLEIMTGPGWRWGFYILYFIKGIKMFSGKHRFCRFLMTGLAVVVVIITLGSLVQAQAPGFAQATNVTAAGVNRPAVVPDGFVVTPFGYFHPSCVMQLREGNTLLETGVQRADGIVEAVPVCQYPHFTANGDMIFAGQTRTIDPTIEGWLEYISVTTNSSYGAIQAGWIVPPLPKVNDGQTLFFFPGLEDINNVQSIVQPVLQWYAPGPWAMASWNCCVQGEVWESTPIRVSPGDTVVGTIIPTCKEPAQYCPKWNVISEDRTTGQKTTLAKTPANNQIWNWAFGAVTEDYDVISCNDFPANKSVTFVVRLYDQDRNVVGAPAWVGTPANGGVQPWCGYNLKVTPTKETVIY